MKTSVRAKWLIRLDSKYKVLVKVGDVISEGQELVSYNREIVKSFDVSFVLSKINRESIDEMLNKWMNQPVNINDVLIDTRGLMPKKLLCPECGVLLGIDEFCNLKIKIP
jgi:hypothetical protein